MMNCKKIGLLLLLAVSSQSYASPAIEVTKQQNLEATKRVYTDFLRSAQPDVTSLTLFANLLPKGGDLHHHFSGSMYAETYLDWAAEKDFCIYKSNDADLKVRKYHVETNPSSLNNAKRTLCAKVEDVRKDNGFYRDLLIQWSSKDYSNHFHDQTAPDQHFFDTFQYFENVAPFGYGAGLKLLKARAKEENVGYIESMLKSGPAITTPGLKEIFSSLNVNSTTAEIHSALTGAFALVKADPQSQPAIDSYIQTIETASEDIDDDDFRLRFLAYAPRNSPPDVVFSRLYSSFVAATQSKKIVGVNVVGPENMGVAMRDYNLHMNMLAYLSKQFPSVSLSLHAGELVLGMVPPEGLRTHINHAVKIAGAKRIGHGVDIAHETNAQDLLKQMAKNNVALEVNLTSNKDILGVSGSAHPLSLYRKFNVPYVISTDDAGVSRNNLSGEYLIYILTFRPSYDGLKKTVYSSIHYSFMSDEDKKREIKKLDARFADFESRMANFPRNWQ